MSQAVKDVLRPPARFQSPSKLTKKEKRELIDMEIQTHKTASLIRPYVALKIKYTTKSDALNAVTKQLSKSANMLEKVMKERNDIRAELEALKNDVDLTKISEKRDRAQEELRASKAEQEKLRQEVLTFNEKLVIAVDEIAAAQTDLTAKQTDMTTAQAELHRLEDLHRRDVLLMEKMTSDNDHLNDVLKGKDDKHSNAKAKLVKYGQAARQSFENVVAQIRVLNPDNTLNTTGLHLQAYVSDKGKLVPPGAEESEDEQPSPSATETQSQL
ncbi:hypothetical protein K1719_011916 [Acacia pycnantha]|nr:hypothetical protein K1719_011916 [Acacia pycnantha]